MTMTILTMTMMMTSKESIAKIGLNYLQEVRLIEEEAFPDHAYTDNELMSMIQREGSETYLYEIQGEPAGYVSFYVKGQKCRVESIGVRPKFRRIGIGKKLMELVEERCIFLGAKKIILETFEFNEAAIRLYEKMGYDVVGIIEEYYTIPFNGSRNAIRLRKLLP